MKASSISIFVVVLLCSKIESKTDCEIIRTWLGDEWLSKYANAYLQDCTSSNNGNIITLQVICLFIRILANKPINRILPQDFWDLSCPVITFIETGIRGSLPNVTNENSALIALDLSSNSLTGIIPESLSNLKKIRNFYLTHNQLVGQLPHSLRLMDSLRFVYLSYNQLQTIPDSISKMKSLTYLLVDSNQLEGDLPSSIGNLTSLQLLDLHNNTLSGVIPESFSKLVNLNILSLSGNHLGGRIPDFIGKLKSLAYLDLSSNSFYGPIPESIGNLTSLNTLNLSFNSLSGPIPQSIGSLKLLYTLYLSFNELNGTIPDLSNLTSLRVVLLNNNNLTGELPKTSSLHFLSVCNMSSNHMCAPALVKNIDSRCNIDDNPCPKSDCDIIRNWMGDEWIENSSYKFCLLYPNSKLYDLYAYFKTARTLRNEVLNDITQDLWKLSSYTISISGSLLNGTFPEVPLNQTALLNFVIVMSTLKRGLPDTMGNFGSLQNLIIAKSNLGDHIPAFIGDILSLQSLKMSLCALKGSIPETIGKLKNLEKLDLSGNRLSGEIPTTISIMLNLKTLDLSYNQLSGSIANLFSYESTLINLNLQKNHFSGTIPHRIAKLSSLYSLDLSFNDISGEIPPLHGLDSLSYLNLANNSLTGSYRQLSLELPNLTQCNIRSNNFCLVGDIDAIDSKCPYIASSCLIELDAGTTRTSTETETAIANFYGQLTSNESPSSAYFVPLIGSLSAFAIILFIVLAWFMRRKQQIKARNPKPDQEVDNKETIWRKINNDLALEKELNAGGFGVVYKGVFKGKVVAVKQLTFAKTNINKYKHARMFMDEAETMLEMKHERIVELIDIDVDSLSLIIEYLELGSLFSYISKNNAMPWLDRYQMMLDIVEGMAFLHSKTFLDGTRKKEVYHQDLKSGNILLTMTNGKLRAKIGDFGLAKLKEMRGNSAISSSVEVNGGTRCYQAPEFFKIVAKFTKKCDVYAAGVVFLEITAQRQPQNIAQDLTPSIFGKGLPDCLETCIKTSLSQDPNNRKHFSELLSILKGGIQSIEVFATNTVKFDKFLKSKAKTIRSTYEVSESSGRVLDSKGNILWSRILGSSISTSPEFSNKK